MAHPTHKTTEAPPALDPLPESLDQELQTQVQEMGRFVLDAVSHNTAAHEVEEGLWLRILALGRGAMKGYFQMAGDGDQGAQIELPDGRQVRRYPKLHTRPYQSIFGSFELSRVVYGAREGQKIEHVPLDQRLQLPESKFSYLLQDWDQRLAVEIPFAEDSAILEKILGFSQSVDSLERMNRKMARDVAEYWNSLDAPAACEEGELMVHSADGKGVVMRRKKGESPAPIEEFQKKSGPKPDSKKMALLGASYTVDRFVRTPDQIVDALFRNPQSDPKDKPKRPLLHHKHLRASLKRSEEGTMEPATAEIFGWLALESKQRNPGGEKPAVSLMDGQISLWDAARSYLPAATVEVLDLLHVTPRLWSAAKLFHPKGSSAVVQFVRQRVKRILQGETPSVVRGLRRMGTSKNMRGKKHKKLKKICRYLENNSSRMKYDEYLKAGYPIATGVIEGACRHLVKDRMERAGMMWGLDGAQAMLDLRSIHLSGQWDEFTKYRIKKETARLYPHAVANDNMEWQKVA